MRGLGRYYEIDASCIGTPNELTGYVVSIHDIDASIRSTAIPLIQSAITKSPWIEPAELIEQLFSAGKDACPVELIGLRWRLTPTYSVSILTPPSNHRLQQSNDPTMQTNRSAQPKRTVIIRQRFDFAASHRLHVDELSDDENVQVFGKCNNEAGHGHNYVIEPAVELLQPNSTFNLSQLEPVVDSVIINRFDHTHLNADTEEFNTAEQGVIPSVENIARICFELLEPAISEASNNTASLRTITVWETDRTSCTYPDAPLISAV